MEAWAKYAIQLTNQLGKRGVHTAQPIGEEFPSEELANNGEQRQQNHFIGENMPSSALENFTDEQIAQVSLSDNQNV